MNFDEIVVKESPGICRCCLSEGCYKDLGSEYIWMNEAEVYADMLLDCFDIGITQHSDGPNGAKRLICEVCITRLRDACNFKKQVLDSEKRFIDMLGRGEFRSKMVLFKPPMELKVESIEEPPEDVMAEDVEYLDDMEYEGNEEDVKVEGIQSTSRATTSEDRPLKRGRPKKDSSPTKAKRQKTVKEPKRRNSEDSLDVVIEESEEEQVDKRLLAMRQNVITVVSNSTVMPFRWLATSYRCFYCYDIFDTAPELKAHNLLHDRDEIKKTMQKYWENDVFIDVSKLSCVECSDDHQTFEELIDHLIKQHDVNYNDETKFCFKPFILKDDEVVCGVCEASFKLFNQLLLHATKEHRNPEDYICDICGRSFKKHQYKMHIYNEHRSKTVTCTQCGELFSSYTIRTHMAKAHGRKVKCKMCSETFSSHYKKQQHMTRVHKARSEFQCPHCPKTFYFQSTMTRHVKQMHLMVKNAMCNVCGYTTYTQSQLKNHMTRHVDDRHVPCQYCNKMFKTNKYLKQHYQISHPEELDNELKKTNEGHNITNNSEGDIEELEELGEIGTDQDGTEEHTKIVVQYLEYRDWDHN